MNESAYGSSGWVSNSTHYDCCHYLLMQECKPFGQSARHHHHHYHHHHHHHHRHHHHYHHHHSASICFVHIFLRGGMNLLIFQDWPFDLPTKPHKWNTCLRPDHPPAPLLDVSQYLWVPLNIPGYFSVFLCIARYVCLLLGSSASQTTQVSSCIAASDSRCSAGA